jgi:hypothetical protein
LGDFALHYALTRDSSRNSSATTNFLEAGASGVELLLVALHVKVPGVAEGIQRAIALICWEVSGASFNRERLGRRTNTRVPSKSIG